MHQDQVDVTGWIVQTKHQIIQHTISYDNIYVTITQSDSVTFICKYIQRGRLEAAYPLHVYYNRMWRSIFRIYARLKSSQRWIGMNTNTIRLIQTLFTMFNFKPDRWHSYIHVMSRQLESLIYCTSFSLDLFITQFGHFNYMLSWHTYIYICIV